VPAKARPLPPPPPPPTAPAAADERDDEEWGDDDERGDAASADAASVSPDAGNVTSDELGALPAGWTLQTDEEGDRWYYHASSGETSWVRPNADGSVPVAQ